MTDLSRNLLSAARDGLTPDAEIAARVRARVAAAVAAPAAAVVAAPVAKTGIALKLGITLAVLGGVVAVLAVTSRNEHAHAPLLSISPVDRDEPSHEVRASASTDAPPVVEAVRTVKPVVVAGFETASLSREVELIDLAMIALRRNAPTAALDAIRVFDVETRGHGQMAEDAAAIAIEAHCHLKHDVTDALARFDARWPSSAQRARIHTSCFSIRR